MSETLAEAGVSQGLFISPKRKRGIFIVLKTGLNQSRLQLEEAQCSGTSVCAVYRCDSEDEASSNSEGETILASPKGPLGVLRLDGALVPSRSDFSFHSVTSIA